MRKTLLFAVIGCLCFFGCKEKAEPTSTEVADQPKPKMEILDMSTTDPLKKSYAAFSNKDVDGFTADMDENIRYNWSSGDSLVGKQAVKDYYTGRFAIIDSIQFSNHIFVPLMANEAQTDAAPAGKWILHWAQTNVKYKNGKAIQFWLHQVNHYNDAGKIDYIGQYIDRMPIAEATKGMK